MNQNNERTGRPADWRTGGLAAWRMQGHARKAKQLQHAAGDETDDSLDNGPSTRVDNASSSSDLARSTWA